MNTLLLDPNTGDLTKDASGNIAMASDPYSQAQDAGCNIALFLGELWYDTTQGIPYFQKILGKYPPISLMKADFSAAALLVPGVVAASAFIISLQNRTIGAQVQITNSDGETAAVNVSATPPSGSA